MSELTLTDIDFYQRKIRSVEQDNIYLHQEIMKLRARLRIAQDFQIKYSLMISNNQRDMERLKIQIQKQEEVKQQHIWMAKLKENDEKWSVKFEEVENSLRKQSQAQIGQLKKQISHQSKLITPLKEKQEEMQFFGFKMGKLDKENQNLKQEIQEMKQFYEKQRTQEITKIRNTLNNNYRQKIEKEKLKYEERIVELQKRLNHLQIEEDKQIFKPSDATNRELITLKSLFQEKSAKYFIQIQELSKQITLKNEEISRVLRENAENEMKYRQILTQKNDYIESVQNKLIERQKEHEIELLNLIQRQTIAKNSEHEELRLQIQRLHLQIQESNNIWREKILNHQVQIEDLNREFDQQRRKIVEQKNMHKRKCSELSSKIKQVQEQREFGDTHTLINSLKDMDFKQDQIGNYQHGITFLERLYKKCQLKLEQKNRALSKLHKDINVIRTQCQRQLNELKQKMKKDRRQYSERILSLENQLRDTEDRLRAKQKQERKIVRQLEKDKLILQQQNKSLKQMNQELQRDYNRVVQDKKGVEVSFRQERQKSFTSKTDLNVIKKQKWLQLQKQKNELQIIFKQKEQQVKLKYEQELDDKVRQISKLKQQLQLLQTQNDLLKKQNEKLLKEYEQNKENSKMAQYNKKMASLNLQIALTQNLYESLIHAKSRINVPLAPLGQLNQSEIKIDVQDQLQSLHMSFHPSAKLQF